MNKPNIAIVIPGGIGTGRANIGVPVLEQLTKLLSSGFSITVFQLYKTNTGYKPEGFDLIEIHSPYPVLRMIKFLRIFRKIHRRKKFNVVHAFWVLPGGFLAVLAGKIFKTKSIVSLQGGDAIALPEINYGQLVKWISRKFSLWTLHHTNELTSPSKYCVDNLKQLGLKRDLVRFIPLGIDTSLFTFSSRQPAPPIKFLHIGNFNLVKDQATLLKAFHLISNEISCQLTIIGEGELEAQIRAMTEQLGLGNKIIFIKPLQYKMLVEYYRESHIMLHTSKSEGHPIVAEEAMSSGVVVCGTRVGLLYDLENCCVSVKVGDYEALARETLKLLDDPQRMETLRRNARQWAESNSIFHTVEKFSELYRT